MQSSCSIDYYIIIIISNSRLYTIICNGCWIFRIRVRNKINISSLRPYLYLLNGCISIFISSLKRFRFFIYFKKTDFCEVECLIEAISMSNINSCDSNALCRLFPERQIMLLSEGNVSFVTLSKRFQLCFVAAILVFVGWSAF